MNILLKPLSLSVKSSSNNEPRFIVESPITLPPVGRFIVGKPDFHISSANCWKAHSSNTIKLAVNERPALSELGKALNTLSLPLGKVMVKDNVNSSNTIPLQFSGAKFFSAIKAGIFLNMTPNLRTNSLASSSVLDSPITVLPSCIRVCEAICSTSHEKPNCRAFKMMFSLCFIIE